MYETSAFCSSRHCDTNNNALSRIINSVVYALNKNVKLPKYLIMVLEDDLISYLNYTDYGISGFYGSWVEFLAKQINDMIHTWYQALPKKAKKVDEPFIYWLALPTHILFKNNQQRSKFNACIDSVIQIYANMRFMKLKELWSFNDSNLVLHNGNYSETGLTVFWRSFDSAVKFNTQKREEFLAKAALFRKRNLTGKGHGLHHGAKRAKKGDKYTLSNSRV